VFICLFEQDMRQTPKQKNLRRNENKTYADPSANASKKGFSNWCWNFFTTLEKILKKKALNQIPQSHLVYHQQNSLPTKNHTVRKHLSAALFKNRGQEEKESRTIVQFDFSGNFFTFQSMRCDLHRTLCPWRTSIRQKNTTQKGVM
jgi:hypothetical protein